MAKIRIYELARDLNMTNKMLLEKIRDMDIDVKSHMSSLENETLALIKEKILGSPAKEI
jgi:translation initiation factor IF-2